MRHCGVLASISVNVAWLCLLSLLVRWLYLGSDFVER